MDEYDVVEEIVHGAIEMLPAERTARRLLALACLLAVVASLILVVDFKIKGQILSKAEELSRGTLRGHREASGRATPEPVAPVDDAAPDDQGDDESADAPLVVG